MFCRNALRSIILWSFGIDPRANVQAGSKASGIQHAESLWVGLVGAIYHFLQRIWSAWPGGRAWVLYIHSFSLKKSETTPTSPTQRVPRGPKGGKTLRPRNFCDFAAASGRDARVLPLRRRLFSAWQQCIIMGLVLLKEPPPRRFRFRRCGFMSFSVQDFAWK
jgi:hypothetical protein